MAGGESVWSSDVRVSMPLPPKTEVGVSMQGFGFTRNGISHEISEEAFARVSTPDFQPSFVPSETVYDDLDVEDRPFASEETF